MPDDELEELADFLNHRCRPAGQMNVSLLDGLLAAYVALPLGKDSPHWEPLIYGMSEEEAWARLFASEEEAERIDDLLWKRLKYVCLAFEENRSTEKFFSGKKTIGAFAPDLLTWSLGYLRGMALRASEWGPLLYADETRAPKPLSQTIALLRLYIGEKKPFEQTPEDFRADSLGVQLSETLPAAAQHIYDYWIREGKERPPLHADPKPRRNESCFCGSGKKYKRCCGAANVSIAR